MEPTTLVDSGFTFAPTTLAIMGAALAVVCGGIGSSIGIRIAGAKGAGVLAEKPHLFSKILLLTALPGSQGVYGLLIALLIVFKAGFITGDIAVTAIEGVRYLGAGISVGLSGFFSGWFQGTVVSSGIGAIARDESLTGQLVGLSVVVETYAIFGLLVAIFLWM